MQVRLTKTLISIKIDIRFGSVTFGKSIEVSTKKLPKSQKNLILPRVNLFSAKLERNPLRQVYSHNLLFQLNP